MQPLPPLQDVETSPVADEEDEESTTTSDDMLTEDMFDMDIEGEESNGESAGYGGGSSPVAAPTSKTMGSGLSMGLGAMGLNSPLVQSIPLGRSLESGRFHPAGVRSEERTQV